MNIERVNLKKGQRPADIDWEDFFNRIIDELNDGIEPGDLLLDGSGRFAINISGDAQTVGGKTVEEIVGGDFPDIKKTLLELITGGKSLVLKGGKATKDAITANKLNITACTVIQKVVSTGYIDRTELPATSKTTSLANTTYFLDVVPGAVDFTWGTEHPSGDFTTIATVVTDSDANISSVEDTRVLKAFLFDGFDGKIIIPGANVEGDTQSLAEHKTQRNPHGTTFQDVGALSANGKAVDSGKVNGVRYTVSKTAPSNPTTNDIWIDIN